MSYFFVVGKQVLILFILISIGYICSKAKMIREEGVKVMTDIALYLSSPCVIIMSFQREPNEAVMQSLSTALIASLAVHLCGIILSYIFIREKNPRRLGVLRFGAVMSNAGFMALPLQQSLLGMDGVLYGAIFIAVANLVMWSWGLIIISGGAKSLSVKTILLNPGIIGLLIGGALFLLKIRLPELVSSPITHISNLNTPLPMLIIGYYLSKTKLREALKSSASYIAMAIRLIVIPLATLGVILLFGIKGELPISLIISAGAPCAVGTTMFAAKYGGDTSLSVNLVSLTTILSVITMPCVVTLVKLLT